MARKNMEIVGMSFLDLAACAFAGLLIMYLIAPRNDQTLSVISEPIEFIKVQTESAKPYRVGIVVDLVGGETVSCWPRIQCAGSQKVSWDVSDGSTNAVIKGAKLSGTGKIALVEYLGSKGLDKCVEVKVSTVTGETIVGLYRDKLYRSEFKFGSESKCI